MTRVPFQNVQYLTRKFFSYMIYFIIHTQVSTEGFCGIRGVLNVGGVEMNQDDHLRNAFNVLLHANPGLKIQKVLIGEVRIFFKRPSNWTLRAHPNLDTSLRSWLRSKPDGGHMVTDQLMRRVREDVSDNFDDVVSGRAVVELR